jgi:lysophospholipase L1-like esterase
MTRIEPFTRQPDISRRSALRHVGALIGLGSPFGAVGLVQGCGGGGSDAAPAQIAVPADDPTTPLGRLKIAMRGAPPLTVASIPIEVSQAQAQSADPSLGADAVLHPPPLGYGVNPNPVSLVDMSEVWGYHRETWTRQAAGYIGSVAVNGSWWVPTSRVHRAATIQNDVPCGLHFVFDGQAFEVLFAGVDVEATLIADGRYMAPAFISTVLVGGVKGSRLAVPNTSTKFDFGTRATRSISLYARSSQGPCAIAVGPRDTLRPWDRSAEASFCAIADSYGQAGAVNWGMGGPFWEAAAALGIPHVDLDAMGGTGYAPNNGSADARNPGNAFVARIADSAASLPDLLLTAGGLNDNNSTAALPLYVTAAAALAGYNSAVSAHFATLRAALPHSVLAATGPWAPVETVPTDPIARSKADTIRSALRSVDGPWVFIDNLNGSWSNSAGASSVPAGRSWQTGTGHIGSPKGDGNGDFYVAADGVHPTAQGCLYLGLALAASLRAAVLAL